MPQTILDQSRDIAGREIHRLTSLYPPPDFVKTASHDRLMGDPESTPGHLYADRAEKIYPHHTAEATWMSTLFFLDKRAEFPLEKQAAIEAALKKASDFFAIGGHIDALKAKVAANAGNDLAQLPDESFAIVWAYEGGSKERHWPLRNATEVKFAAQTFAKNRDQFGFADRHTIANKILDAALEFGASTGGFDDVLEKCAGRGACSAREAAEAYEKRASLVRLSHPDMAEELTKVASIIRANPIQARGHDQLVKLADGLDQADRAGDLLKFYDNGLERPEDTLFCVTEKLASDFATKHVSTTTGKVYEVAELVKVAVAQYREWLGDDFADAVSTAGVLPDGAKIAAVLPTMDKGMASTFDRMADHLKIMPIMREKAAAVGGILSGDALYKYALQYAE